MVTAELAIALPVLVLVGLLAVCGVQAVLTQLRCRDAAGVAARLAGRGESDDVVAAAVAVAAPHGSTLSVRREGELVVASVQAQVRWLGIGALLPGLHVSETAVSVAEGGSP